MIDSLSRVWRLSLIFIVSHFLTPSRTLKPTVKANFWILMLVAGQVINLNQFLGIVAAYYGGYPSKEEFIGQVFLALYIDTFYIVVQVLVYQFVYEDLVYILRKFYFKEETTVTREYVRDLNHQLNLIYNDLHQSRQARRRLPSK